MLLAAPLGRLHAEPTFPQLTGRITDEAGLLSAADRNEIDTVLAALEAKSTDQLAIVTLKSLQGYDIADYGYQLGRKWGIGQAGKNNGILLIVAPNERKVQDRGRPRPRADDDRRHVEAHHRERDPARVPPRQLPGRHPRRRARHQGRAARRRRGGQAAREAHSSDNDTMSVVLLIFWICVVLFILYAVYSSSVANQQMAAGGRRGRRGGAAPVIVPGDSGGWGGGWSGGDGGGGWSGGGGDFGGGGSSGSW